MISKNKKPLEAGKQTKGLLIKNNVDININDKNFKTEKSEELIILTFFKGPVINTIPDNSDQISWNDFSVLFKSPQKGTKDGSYFVRTKCHGNRNDTNMDSLSSILIIDADQGIDGKSCPQPEYVSEFLNNIGYRYILYTSFTYTPEKPKYRIIFLLDRMIEKFELKQLYQRVIKMFIDNDIRIKENSESKTWSQPWFFPRYQTNEQQNNFFHSDGGIKKLPVDDILSKYTEEQIFCKSEKISQDQLLKLKKETPPCIIFLSTDTTLEATEHRNFNSIKMTLNAYGLSAGLDKTDIVSLCQDFINNYSFSNSLATPKLRQSNFEKCYDSMKQNERCFSCATVQALKVPKNTFNCTKCAVENPNTVEDILEWIEEIKDHKEIKDNWIEKINGMNAVDTEEIRLAVHDKTGIGKQALTKDLRTQQKKQQREKNKKIRERKIKKRKAEGKKEIFFKKTSTGKAVKEISRALADYNGSDCVYRYGTTLVSIVKEKPSTIRMVKRMRSKNTNYPDMLIVKPHTIETLRHEIEKVACCIGENKQGYIEEIIWPNILIKGLMDTQTSFDKPLIGIIEHPFIDENFNPVMEQGYDHSTGLFRTHNLINIFDFIKEEVTIELAKKSYKFLSEVVLAEFPFATELDKAGAVSALLTALQRKLITGDSGCPGYLFDAPTQSTGKTTLAQAVSYSIYGRPIAATSWSNDDNEMGKHIFGILREGHSAVLFDNLPNGTILKSDELAKAMTSASYSKRILGENKTESVPSNVLWIFTGNNISVVDDFNTRIISIRLDAKKADPDRRKFKRNDIGEWCLKKRNEIISACMIIILILKECNIDRDPTRYHEWDKFVRIPIKIASGEDISDLFERNKSLDPKIEGQKLFLEAWYDQFGSNPMSAKEIIEKVSEELSDNYTGICSTSICEALKDIFSKNLPNSLRLGRWLSGMKDRIIGDFKLTAMKGKGRINHNVTLWTVESINNEKKESDVYSSLD